MAFFPPMEIRSRESAGLPDGRFTNQKLPSRSILEVLAMADAVDLFYGHWVYFIAICYIMWPFGLFYM
jgi:hypothetical protein